LQSNDDEKLKANLKIETAKANEQAMIKNQEWTNRKSRAMPQ